MAQAKKGKKKVYKRGDDGYLAVPVKFSDQVNAPTQPVELDKVTERQVTKYRNALNMQVYAFDESKNQKAALILKAVNLIVSNIDQIDPM